MAEKGGKQDKRDLDDTEDTQDTEAGGKSGKLKIILLIVLGVVLLVGGSVGATLFFLGGSNDAASEDKETAAAEAEAPVKPKALYVPMQPAFVMNYQVNNRQRYLQVGVMLLVRDEATVKAVETHMPVMRNRMVMLFSGESFEELQGDAGRAKLQEKALAALQEIMQKETGNPGIEQVLFSDFVMQ